MLKHAVEEDVGLNGWMPEAAGFCFEVPAHRVDSGYEGEVALRLGLIKFIKNAPVD